MNARDLVKMVDGDHEFRTMVEDRGFRLEGTRITLKCSCGWHAKLMVHDTAYDYGYAEAQISGWINWEGLNHLLDVEIDVEDVLGAIEKGELE